MKTLMVDSFNGEDDSFSDCRQGFDSLIDRLVGDNAKVTDLNRGSNPALHFYSSCPRGAIGRRARLKIGKQCGFDARRGYGWFGLLVRPVRLESGCPLKGTEGSIPLPSADECLSGRKGRS